MTDPLALSNEMPEMSARTPVVAGQKVFLTALLILIAALFLWKPWGMARAIVAFCTVFYVLASAYKFLLVRLSVSRASETSISETDIAKIGRGDMPVYSILVPMYHEPESAANLVKAIEALDYPAAKKDVQLLLEEDDAATRDAVAAVELPSGFRVTIVPETFPRTKPKACNIGLDGAKGKYLVIYDAEDRPEPDQLKKAVAAFSHADASVMCLQSKLNFYNPRQNLLARWFTAEYSAWFDMSLPGLCALGAVIPLGGTSNHFVTDKLRELRGWDAFNVTEDCDLGVRIYRAGYKSCMLDTTTWEEACCSLKFWTRQRTRWLKGYIQTYLVHMRNPGRLVRELGVANFLHFQILVGGIIFTFLVNPVFWLMALLWFLVPRMEILSVLFPGLVFAMGAICLFIGNFAFAYIGAVGCYRREYFDLVKYAFLAPVYWLLMSYSGWRALIQFFANPFHWEKTRHGLSKQTTD
jgi:cellulose synthase/poly-beta-1,6-N-acetylglucosamine synthase-like glycosyltransferase